jgi:glycosyltransferase involved in cell wall biosynthesis
MQPLVSVIIATYNRQALLAQTLDALAGQSWSRDSLQVIVADNGSTDDTRLVVESAQRSSDIRDLEYLLVTERGKSWAVNAALAEARGDILALTDDDVWPDSRWIDRLAAAFDETGADFVAGRVRPIWQSSPPNWMSPALYGVLAIPDNGDRRLELSADRDDQPVPIGANMAVRRHVVERIGGLRTDLGKLDGTLRTGEDHEFFLRMLHADFRGVYEPSALVHHWVPVERLTRDYFRRWLYQNGRDVARLEAAYPHSSDTLFGIPRYRWREAVMDAWRATEATFRGDVATRFAALTRILWLGGYVRETWR